MKSGNRLGAATTARIATWGEVMHYYFFDVRLLVPCSTWIEHVPLFVLTDFFTMCTLLHTSWSIEIVLIVHFMADSIISTAPTSSYLFHYYYKLT